MRVCTKCGEAKTTAHFFADSQKKSGLRPRCKTCEGAAQKERIKLNPGTSTQYVRAWRKRNPEKFAASNAASDKKREYDRRRYAENAARKEAVDRRSRESARRHPDREWAKTVRRRTAILQRNVKWADPKKIRAIYQEAKRIERETGIPHEVDHIIPLRGKTVSGLHWEGNLQILPKVENIKKSNKLIEAYG